MDQAIKQNMPYLLVLHSINGLGPIRLKKIIDYFHDPKLAWDATPTELEKLGIPKNVIQNLLETHKYLDPHQYLDSIKTSGIKWVTVFDQDYPKSLRQIYDPPVVLYYQGEILFSDQKAVAVVGTRKITGYGELVTRKFTQDLVNAGFTIVSGLARGVDSIAHQQALASKGRTMAVLGGGIKQIFPPENTGLAQKIASGFGAIISEFPPDYPALAGNFPARNRIIAGLSKAVLVTEAASDSGSLITARFAAESGRDVFTIPGPITSSLSKGPIELIRQGARIVYEAKDILDEMGVSASKPTSQTVYPTSNEEEQILQVLENESIHIDEIGRKLKLPAAKISALLLKLEIAGLVKNLGAGVYSKV